MITKNIKFDINKYKKTELENGLRVISEYIPNVESFALGISINAGSRRDPQGLSGLAHFFEHICFRDTENRSSKQIAYQFESIGANTNAFTTKEMICFYARALKQHFNNTLDILSDLILYPKFNVKDIEKERNIIIEEIKSIEDDPEELIFDITDNILFKNSGLAPAIAGTINSVKNISQENLIVFKNKYITPENIVISFTGNINHEKAVEEINRHFSHLKKNNFSNEFAKISTHKTKTQFVKPYHQNHIVICRKIPGIKHKDRISLIILASLLGEGTSSRLYQKLREQRSLAYSIFANVHFFSDAGAFYIYIATDKSNASKSKVLIFDELQNLIEKKIHSTELKRAKELTKTNITIDLESLSARMQRLAKYEFIFGYNEDVANVIEQINSIQVEDIKQTAIKYFDLGSWETIEFVSNI
ncbi:MAG TPA: pitrilysin family protein [Candidatus Kapabacteria bacterium]|nr:pitrilysin family protein [Candidatus Kapabacteria bacterium]HPO63515.1 pitrilysin family protein [Candidatus Kapabacteria bacterium]